jgi:hypothetical protein
VPGFYTSYPVTLITHDRPGYLVLAINVTTNYPQSTTTWRGFSATFNGTVVATASSQLTADDVYSQSAALATTTSFSIPKHNDDGSPGQSSIKLYINNYTENPLTVTVMNFS